MVSIATGCFLAFYVIFVTPFEEGTGVFKDKLVFLFGDEDSFIFYIVLMGYAVMHSLEQGLCVVFPNFSWYQAVVGIDLEAIIPDSFDDLGC